MIVTVPLVGGVTVRVPCVGISVSLAKTSIVIGVSSSVVTVSSATLGGFAFTVIVTIALSQLGVGVAVLHIVYTKLSGPL